MDLPRSIQNATFTKIRDVLFEVTSKVADKFMSEAVDEKLRLTRTNSQNEICEPESVNPEAISQLSIEDLDENMLDDESDVTNTPDEIITCKREIGVQGDGTWQRQDHRSYNGVFTILSQESGKIIDLEVLSYYCLQSNQYEKVHGSEERCLMNRTSLDLVQCIDPFSLNPAVFKK
ncbi:hypothetical protein TSAR_014358 [Trichomalopsis sarcophagae]|uniref:Mutator-like transposase domain-containing protein n=1 Tax=Trichomalopsis sarcophagae TaxID=543379 RepID=A0A232EDI1_9HYME|nr:hypothetical protein TSAR_014358 [Trichomalopsis sarcophagae]